LSNYFRTNRKRLKAKNGQTKCQVKSGKPRRLRQAHIDDSFTKRHAHVSNESVLPKWRTSGVEKVLPRK